MFELSGINYEEVLEQGDSILVRVVASSSYRGFELSGLYCIFFIIVNAKNEGSDAVDKQIWYKTIIFHYMIHTSSNPSHIAQHRNRLVISHKSSLSYTTREITVENILSSQVVGIGRILGERAQNGSENGLLGWVINREREVIPQWVEGRGLLPYG